MEKGGANGCLLSRPLADSWPLALNQDGDVNCNEGRRFAVTHPTTHDQAKCYAHELQRSYANDHADQMHKVQNEQKTDFDYVVYDSDVERQFAEKLDSREDIKLFMKLPSKFKIDTPVGPYNPDWAIIKQEDGEDRIYMIRETKSTLDDSKLRPSEVAKIKSAREHFKAIGITDYGRSVPEKWNL